MLASLGVREIRPVVLVDCQAQSALEAADVVLEEVRVFVQVDCFEGELAESFASVGVCGGLGGDAAAAEFGPCAVLAVRC